MLAYSSGLMIGLTNAVRHRVRGYTTPRPFGADDLERSADYAIIVGDRWQQLVAIKGKRVLEIGPGPDLGTGAVLLAAGARSYHAVDMFPLADRDLAGFYATLERRIGPIDSGLMRYTIASFPDLPELDEEFDIAISHATLEHVPDIPGLFRRLRQLVPAGVMCHHVDAMTHTGIIRERDPLNILRYGDAVYDLMSFPGVPNRLRAGDYADAASAAGFTGVQVLPERRASQAYLDRVRAGLASRYASRGDVDVLTFNLVTGADAPSTAPGTPPPGHHSDKLPVI
jgi:Methyltransferase domain